MDQATWLQMSANTGQQIRSAQLNYSLGTTAGLAILVFGDTADFKLPIAISIIAMAIYGLLAPIGGLQSWKELIKDMPESLASTASGAAAKKAPALCGQDLVSALSRFHLPAHPEKLRLTVK